MTPPEAHQIDIVAAHASGTVYLTDGKRLVEVLWIEDDTLTVSDSLDESIFKIEKHELPKWESVDPAVDDG